MNKLIHVYPLLLIFVFCTSCGQNQTSVPKDNIKSEIKDIGPNIMVRNIKKGRNGTILIAGPNNSAFGDVFRYDPRGAVGKSFTNLTSKIGQHKFWDALEDRKGNLWFATTDSGVFLLNDQVSGGQAVLKHFTTRDGLADNRVMSVYEDRAGIIWFGTGGGLSRYDPRWAVSSRVDGKLFQNFKNPIPSRVYKGGNWNNDITTIIEDRTGKLWVGTKGDAFVFDGKTFTTLTDKGKPFTNVWSIIEDRTGNIWLGDVTHGLWRYDPSTGRRSDGRRSDSLSAGGGTFTKVSERGAYAIIEDKKGNIWTTGPTSPAHVAVWALSRYDAKSLYVDKPTVTEIMSGDAFMGLLEDSDGSIWFGSATGVYRYDGRMITDFYSKEVQKKYIIDTKQSGVVWKCSMLFGTWEGTTLIGDGTSTGDVDILKGELLIEGRRLVGGAVEVDMNTIEAKYDHGGPHNKFPEFFDINKFPVSTFAITKVEIVSDGKTPGRNGNMTIEGIATIKVTGNLTIEGITKSVTFPAQMYFKDGMDGTVVLNGTLIIDRTDWGFSDQSGDLTISDEVKLFMKIAAKK